MAQLNLHVRERRADELEQQQLESEPRVWLPRTDSLSPPRGSLAKFSASGAEISLEVSVVKTARSPRIAGAQNQRVGLQLMTAGRANGQDTQSSEFGPWRDQCGFSDAFYLSNTKTNSAQHKTDSACLAVAVGAATEIERRHFLRTPLDFQVKNSLGTTVRRCLARSRSGLDKASDRRRAGHLGGCSREIFHSGASADSLCARRSTIDRANEARLINPRQTTNR